MMVNACFTLPMFSSRELHCIGTLIIRARHTSSWVPLKLMLRKTLVKGKRGFVEKWH